MAATPPAVMTGADSGSTTTIEAGITFYIDPPGQQYTLAGTYNTGSDAGKGGSFILAYHATFEDAITLGPIGDIAPSIATALQFPELAKVLTDAGNAIKNSYAGFAAILDASLKITDIEINTLSSTYQIGVALDFTTIPDKIEFAGITLQSLSFKVTSTKAAS